MKRIIGRVLLFVGSMALVGSLATPAFAHRKDKDHGFGQYSHSAPEIDPAALGSAAALLGGGALLLNARRTRKSV
jgi:hypothetical protein